MMMFRLTSYHNTNFSAVAVTLRKISKTKSITKAKTRTEDEGPCCWWLAVPRITTPISQASRGRQTQRMPNGLLTTVRLTKFSTPSTTETRVQHLVNAEISSTSGRAWQFVTHTTICYHSNQIYSERRRTLLANNQGNLGQGHPEHVAKSRAREEFVKKNIQLRGFPTSPSLVRSTNEK
jgi:hypothetical protein